MEREKTPAEIVLESLEDDFKECPACHEMLFEWEFPDNVEVCDTCWDGDNE